MLAVTQDAGEKAGGLGPNPQVEVLPPLHLRLSAGAQRCSIFPTLCIEVASFFLTAGCTSTVWTLPRFVYPFACW